MSLLSGLIGGSFRMPDAAINYGGPLPSFPPNALQFSTPDGRFQDSGSLLPGGLFTPYAYGSAARISTQTQMAHPNRVALTIPKLYIPSPESDGLDHSDPKLEHSISDGDLAFVFRMGPEMTSYGSQYCVAPYGYAAKAVPLINLATVNYILWGLQVGVRRAQSTRWKTFFSKLTKGTLHQFSDEMNIELVWNFIKTYLRPFGIMHGSDTQGGQHEGDSNHVVTHGAVDYVSSFAIEGKLLHVNNLWRDYDVHENDDLILSLQKMDAPHNDISFGLSSSVRAYRTERVSISNGWYFLRPETLQFKSFRDIPYIHIGRSQKSCTLFSRGKDICCWDARMCVIPGAPLQITFEPGFVDSDEIHYKQWEMMGEEDGAAAGSAAVDLDANVDPSDLPPVTIEQSAHAIRRNKTNGGGRVPQVAMAAEHVDTSTLTTAALDASAVDKPSSKKQKTKGTASSTASSAMNAFGMMLGGGGDGDSSTV